MHNSHCNIINVAYTLFVRYNIKNKKQEMCRFVQQKNIVHSYERRRKTTTASQKNIDSSKQTSRQFFK